MLIDKKKRKKLRGNFCDKKSNLYVNLKYSLEISILYAQIKT